MTRRPGPGRSLITRQHAAVASLKRDLFGVDGSLTHPYFRDLRRDLRRPAEPIPVAAVLERCVRADVVYLGDFHADPECQRFAARVLEHVAARAARTALGVEFVYTRQQSILDRRQSGALDDAAFLRRVHYREEWGYPWEGFRTLLDRARSLGIPVHALDRAPRGGFDRTAARDRHAADRISAVLESTTGVKLIVLFGESHLSRGHVPRLVARRMKRAGGLPRTVQVFQDPDDVYWRLLRRTGEVPPAAQLAEDAFAVFHTAPLAKYEAYRQVLERWKGDVPPDEEVDLTPAVHHVIDVLRRWLELREREVRLYHRAGWAEDLEDAYPEVYGGPEAADLIGPILADHGRSREEIDDARQQLTERGAVYDARSNALFLSRYLPGRAAGEGARFLRTALSGRLFEDPAPSADPAERAYGAAYNEALVYLGARLVDPAAASASAASSIPPVGVVGEDVLRERMEWLDAHRRFEQSRRISPPEALLAPLRISRPLRRAVARELGHRMGRILFARVASGSMPARQLRAVFALRVDAPRARHAVLRWLRAGES